MWSEAAWSPGTLDTDALLQQVCVCVRVCVSVCVCVVLNIDVGEINERE